MKSTTDVQEHDIIAWQNRLYVLKTTTAFFFWIFRRLSFDPRKRNQSWTSFLKIAKINSQLNRSQKIAPPPPLPPRICKEYCQSAKVSSCLLLFTKYIIYIKITDIKLIWPVAMAGRYFWSEWNPQNAWKKKREYVVLRSTSTGALTILRCFLRWQRASHFNDPLRSSSLLSLLI